MINQINIMSHACLEYLIASSLQISVVFILVLFLSYIFRNKPASFLHLLWCVVIFKAMIPPSLNILKNNPVELPTVSFVSTNIAFSSAERASTSLTAVSVVVIAVVLVIIVFLTTFVIQNISLHRNLHQNRIRHIISQNVEDTLIQKLSAIPLYLTPGISTPMTVGFIHPKIYLPEAAVNWDNKKVESIISHEIAHIKRKDAFTALFQMLIQTVYFFHPLVWIANRQISLYQEQACDDHALLNFSQSPEQYGKILLSFLEVGCVSQHYSFARSLIISDRRILKKRVKYLIKKKEDHMLSLNRTEKLILTGIMTVAFMLSCQKEQTLEQTANQNQIAQNRSALEVPVEEGMIIGSIVDKKTGEGLPGANIFTSDSEYGAASNFKGDFQILLPAGSYEIHAQFLGFKTQIKKNVNVRSGVQTNLNFEMDILSKKEFEQQIAEKENLLRK
ncbi:MAG: M48 family metalloprotease [Candidatus Marinimicrobia bacterium]|nr:M48 family metalloprotease [Candidatus Neomarinimicrobiota bacterium]